METVYVHVDNVVVYITKITYLLYKMEIKDVIGNNIIETNMDIEILVDLEHHLNDLFRWRIPFGIDFPIQSTFGEYYSLYIGDDIDIPSDDDPENPNIIMTIYTSKFDSHEEEVFSLRTTLEQIFNLLKLVEHFTEQVTK